MRAFRIFCRTGRRIQRSQWSRVPYMDMKAARYLSMEKETPCARWVTFEVEGVLYRIHAIKENRRGKPSKWGRWGFNTISIRPV